MELQLEFEVWGSMSELNGRCLKKLWEKCMSQMSYGTQVAEPALFCQRNVTSGYGVFRGSSNRVLGQLGCVEDEYKVFLSSGLQEVKVVYVLQSYLFLKPRSSCFQCRPVTSIMYAATFALGKWDLRTHSCLKDLAYVSRIWNLT